MSLPYDEFDRDYENMDMESLQVELRKADTRITELTNQLEITDLFPQIERLQFEVQRLSRENAALHEEISAGNLNVEDGIEQNADSDRLRLLQDEVAALRNECDTYRERESSALLATAAAERTLEDATAQLAGANERCDVTHQKLRDLQAQLEAEQGATATANEQRDRAAAHAASLEGLLADHSVQGMSAQQENAALQERVNHLQVKLATLGADHEVVQQSIERLAREKGEAEGRLGAEVDRLRASGEEMRADVLALRHDREALQQEMRSSQDVNHNFGEEVRRRDETIGELEQKLRQEKGKVVSASKRINDLDQVVADYKQLLEKGKSDTEKLKEKLAASHLSLTKMMQDSDAGLKATKQNRLLKEQVHALSDRIAAFDDERGKAKREWMKQNQRLQEVTVTLSRSHEKEKAAVRELKKTRDENAALKDSLRSSSESSLRKQIDELTISNAVLKEMVRSANINSRVALARNHKGLRRPSQSTVRHTTKAVEAGTRQPHPASQHKPAYIPPMVHHQRDDDQDPLTRLIESNAKNFIESTARGAASAAHRPPPPRHPHGTADTDTTSLEGTSSRRRSTPQLDRPAQSSCPADTTTTASATPPPPPPPPPPEESADEADSDREEAPPQPHHQPDGGSVNSSASSECSQGSADEADTDAGDSEQAEEEADCQGTAVPSHAAEEGADGVPDSEGPGGPPSDVASTASGGGAAAAEAAAGEGAGEGEEEEEAAEAEPAVQQIHSPSVPPVDAQPTAPRSGGSGGGRSQVVGGDEVVQDAPYRLNAEYAVDAPTVGLGEEEEEGDAVQEEEARRVMQSVIKAMEKKKKKKKKKSLAARMKEAGEQDNCDAALPEGGEEAMQPTPPSVAPQAGLAEAVTA